LDQGFSGAEGRWCREGQLKLLPAPTPRWPDLLIAYYPQDRLLFSSKLFAAHVSPDIVGNPRTNPSDLGGFDVFGKDWKYYFDCMLAPVARQAQGRFLPPQCRFSLPFLSSPLPPPFLGF
jgi:flavorubredoxin